MDIHSVALVLFIHAAALISPGPDFAVVTKVSTVNGRRSGMMAALGVATAIGCYALVCALGIAVMLSALPFLSIVMAYGGALYLFWLGVSSLLSKGEMAAPATPINRKKAYFIGFLTNILNPKAMLYFGSILPQVLKPDPSGQDAVLLVLLLFIESLLWFSFVAFIFSSERVLLWLQGRLVWFERVIGIVLIGLAIKLVVSINR